MYYIILSETHLRGDALEVAPRQPEPVRAHPHLSEKDAKLVRTWANFSLL